MGTIWENENLKIHLAIESTAACCSVLQRVAACCSVLQCGQVISPLNRLLGVAVCCSVLQCVAVCCSVLHGVAGFYSHLATGFTIYKNHTANFGKLKQFAGPSWSFFTITMICTVGMTCATMGTCCGLSFFGLLRT